MYISKAYVRAFGCLANRQFSFEPGMNILAGPNESGKTTLAVFIRMMLFGMERGRGRGAAHDVYTRYMPSGRPAEYGGWIRFVCGGRRFHLERHFLRSVSRELPDRLYCLDDGEELSIENGDLRMLLGGVTAGAFLSTCFAGRLHSLPRASLLEMLERETEILQTRGMVDLRKITDGLRQRQKGLDKKLAGMQDEARLQSARRSGRVAYVRQEIRNLDEKAEELKRRLSGIDEIQLESSSEDANASAMQTDRASLDHAAFQGVGASLDHTAFQTDREPADHERDIVDSRQNKSRGIWRRLASVLRGLWSVIRRILSGGHLGGCDKAGRAGQHFDEVNDRRWHRQGERDRHKHMRQSQERLRWEYEQVVQESLRRQRELMNLEEETENDQVAPLYEKMRDLEQTRQNIRLAMKGVEAAGRAMGQSGRREYIEDASTILFLITGNKYKITDINSDGEIVVSCAAGEFSAEQLSAGTLGALLFSLRMAGMALISEEEMPMFFDESFADMDDGRVENIIGMLADSGRQIFIFSCHERERNLYENHFA